MQEPADKEKVDLQINGGTIVTMNPQREIIDDGFVVINGERIVGVGQRSGALHRYEPARVIDAKDKLVMPGLINAHTHAPMSLFRGIADDLRLMDWLRNYIFPAEAKNVTKDFVRWGTLLSCWEMIRSGTTTFVDMYFFEDEIAAAAEEAGMRAVVGQGVFDAPTPDSQTSRDGLAQAEALIDKWKENKLISPAIATHSAYICEPETLREAKALADRYGVLVLIHLAESQNETEIIRERHGTTPTRYLHRIGLLDRNVLAAHCVWLDDEDISLLKESSVGVAHCPQSNMKLASGIAPVPKMLDAGINVGLGTDAPASNNNLDLFEEMGTAAMLHKVAHLDPTAVTALQAVEMATLCGARALNLQDEIGSIEVGKKADLIILTLDEPNEIPLYNIYSHLVYAIHASDVETSIINGNVVMQHRNPIGLDTGLVREKARQFRLNILKSLG